MTKTLFFPIIISILGHEIPTNKLLDTSGFNLYPTCKHATVAMTHSIRRELAEAKLPIRITVSTIKTKNNVKLFL